MLGQHLEAEGGYDWRRRHATLSRQRWCNNRSSIFQQAAEFNEFRRALGCDEALRRVLRKESRNRLRCGGVLVFWISQRKGREYYRDRVESMSAEVHKSARLGALHPQIGLKWVCLR